MTFLNPIFLWAAFAALIPVIVHLFNFRRPKKILFSDISFVKEVKKSVVRRLKLRQYLLLAARVLAILFLVMMFADPVWTSGTEGQVTVGKSDVAIVLDNSYSMRGGNDRGDYWNQALKLGREIVQAHPKSDNFLVMTSRDLKLHYNFGDQDAALRSLKELKVSQNDVSLKEILDLQKEIFAQSTSPNKKLYIISDFQQSTLLADSAWSEIGEGEAATTLVPLSTRPLRNVYVDKAEIVSRILEKDKPFTVRLTLVNDSREPVKNVGLRLVENKGSRPVATEDLDAGERKEIEFTITPKESGWNSAWLELDDNPVTFDNQRYFTYYVPDRERMLIAEGISSPHLRLIFSEDVITQFKAEFIDLKNIGSADLTQYKSVVLSGVDEISTGLQEKLRAHLKSGRALMIFPGEKMRTDNLNGFLRSVNAGSFGDLVETESGAPASQADLEHPIFEGVFVSKGGERKFDAPRIFRHYRFQPSGNVVQTPILRMDNGDIILSETQPEEGLMYVWSVFPGESWTDLTLKSSGFAVLIQLARMMNHSREVTVSMQLGDLGFHRVKSSEKGLIRMLDKEGKEFAPGQYAQGGYIVLDFAQMESVDLKEGNYDLVQDKTLLEKISFNVPDAESKLEAASKEELEELIEGAGLQDVFIQSPEPGVFEAHIREGRVGLPLWKYFLAFAALFFFCEFLILRIKEKS